MPRMSKHTREEMEFYINPETGRIAYNNVCRTCKYNCKQSFRVRLLNCKRYKRKVYDGTDELKRMEEQT